MAKSKELISNEEILNFCDIKDNTPIKYIKVWLLTDGKDLVMEKTFRKAIPNNDVATIRKTIIELAEAKNVRILDFFEIEQIQPFRILKMKNEKSEEYYEIRFMLNLKSLSSTKSECFDVDKMYSFVEKQIMEFSPENTKEEFCDFALDANLLCLNTKSNLEFILKEYASLSDTMDLRKNTGDYRYQGFAEFSDATGFCSNLYEDHYNSTDEEQKTSAYAEAMNKLVERIIANKTQLFSKLKLTDDFSIFRVEHNY